MSGLEPGWYTNDEGVRRYWDGEQWLTASSGTGESAQTPGPGARKKKNSTRKWAAIMAIVAVLGAGVIATKMFLDQQQEQAAAAEEAEKREEEAKARAEKRKAEREAEKAEAEKRDRAEAVEELESAVKKLAAKHAADGFHDNEPVADVSCSPSGLSEDDERGDSSTRYQCFVPFTHISGDEYEGTYYYGLINWDSGQMSYGLN